MRPLLSVVMVALDLLEWIVVASAVLSWLLAFNVVNFHNQAVRTLWTMLTAVTDPLLKPIRKRLPLMNGIDISPVILILAIILLQRLIAYNMYPMAMG